MRLAIVASVALLVLGITTPILAFNQPAIATSKYEILEPETWVGKELPILRYIDIGDQLRTGAWLVLFYHYDCPECRKAIPQYQQMAHDLAGNKEFPRVAFVEIPPCNQDQLREDQTYVRGRLGDICRDRRIESQKSAMNTQWTIVLLKGWCSMSGKRILGVSLVGLMLLSVAVVNMEGRKCGVQLLNSSQLASYVGAQCSICVGAPGTGCGCSECLPDVDTDYVYRIRADKKWSTAVSRGCVSGTPNNCSPDSGWWDCGSMKVYRYLDQGCGDDPYNTVIEEYYV